MLDKLKINPRMLPSSRFVFIDIPQIYIRFHLIRFQCSTKRIKRVTGILDCIKLSSVSRQNHVNYSNRCQFLDILLHSLKCWNYYAQNNNKLRKTINIPFSSFFLFIARDTMIFLWLRIDHCSSLDFIRSRGRFVDR